MVHAQWNIHSTNILIKLLLCSKSRLSSRVIISVITLSQNFGKEKNKPAVTGKYGKCLVKEYLYKHHVETNISC